jgi:type II secretory pathway pseudopilin PulG
LLEAVIALVLLATVMVSVGAGLSGSIRSTSFSRSTDQARLLASQQMVKLRAQFEANDASVASLTGTVGCALNAQNEIDFSASPVSGYQNTVTLSMGDSGGSSTSFDVRWNIQQISVSGVNPPSSTDKAYVITVGVQPQDTFNRNAVNLHALVQ